MIKILVFLTLSLFVAFTSYAQETLQFTPEQPQPGDEINFTYQPNAVVFSTNDKVECTALFYLTYPTSTQLASGMSPLANNVSLTKTGNTYQGSIAATKGVAFIALEFYTTKFNDRGVLTYDKMDINDSIGYPILFYTKAGKILPKSSFYEGIYYKQNTYPRGEERNNFIGNIDLANKCFEQEMQDYPEAKYYVISDYTRLLQVIDKDKAKAYCEKELEKTFADSLNTQDDYDYVIGLLYGAGRKKEAGFFNKLKDEKKFDSRMAKINNIFFTGLLGPSKENPKDYESRNVLVDSICSIYNQMSFIEKLNMQFSTFLPSNLQIQAMDDVINNGSLKEGLDYGKNVNCTEKTRQYYAKPIGSLIDTIVYDHAKTKAEKAEAVAAEKEIYDYYTNQADLLLSGKPVSINGEINYKTVIRNTGSVIYPAFVSSVIYTDMLIKEGDCKKAAQSLSNAKKYMQTYSDEIMKYLLGDYNTVYAKVAKHCYPKKKYKQALEEIVATGKYDNNVTDELREMYMDEHSSDQGFDAYISDLKKEVYADMQKEFDDQKLNEKAAEFSLKDMQGNTVTLASLKGKIVVFDFWATWCGPCRASFPAMKELVEEYKSNTDVVYLFVNSGERFEKYEDNVKAVNEIIEAGNYPFHVVLDFDKSMVKNFGVNAFPTKIIMDKDGNIRYRIAGAQLDAVKLKDEIRIMIGSIK